MFSSTSRFAMRALTALLSLLLGLGLLGVATPANAAYAKPSSVKAISTSTTAARITWKGSAKAPAYYRVKYASNSKMKSPSYLKTTSTAIEITKLKPGKTYWVKVRIIKGSKALTGYSKTIKVTTRKSGSYSLLSPVGLALRSATASSLTLGWTARGGATHYRVRLATSTSLANALYKHVSGTSTTITGLRNGIAYYASVRAVTKDGKELSQYSPMVTIRTIKVADLTPTGLTAKPVSTTSLSVSWKAVAGASKYRFRYATTQWTNVKYVTTSATTYRLSGLSEKTTYYVAVQALSSSGSTLSGYSQPAKATTWTDQSPLRVASYNIRSHNSFSGASNEKPWVERRAAVVETIKGADPDVVGLQEAQQSRLIDATTGKAGSLSQFEDLIARLGSPWALTNKYRYNCVKSTTSSNCVAKDMGASNGTKIVYRSDRLELISQGSEDLPKATSSSYTRYVSWAIFRQKSSGTEFVFADIHLEPLKDAAGSATFYNNRKAQASAAVAEIAAINTKRLPVVLVGDANSNYAASPTNAPYEVFRAAGWVDPLGGVSNSSVPVGATVEKRIRTNYNSFNAWESYARRSLTRVNGTYIDYIFTSPMRVSEWETVVKVDANNRFVGIIPSDHNLIRATVWLP